MRNQKGNNEIVQCKQLNTKVDLTEIKKFSRAMRKFDAERGHYWAPAGFTRPAMEYAEANHIIWYDEQRIMKTVSAANKEIEKRNQMAMVGSVISQPKTQPRPMQLPSQRQPLSGLRIMILIILGITVIILICATFALFIFGPTIFNSFGK